METEDEEDGKRKEPKAPKEYVDLTNEERHYIFKCETFASLILMYYHKHTCRNAGEWETFFRTTRKIGNNVY